ncbi:MAG TPA: hypothetical protein VGN39_13095 [Terriglobales bacterium]|nr:hypothetical protein [Terriglobales bacterium]
MPIGEQRQSLNAAASQPQIIVSGVNEPLVFSKIDSPKKDFAPRLGFAYSPGESGNTSIRGGFGMAYDVLYDNIGVLAPPPQLGATNDVPDLNTGTANFLGGGGLNGGGSGITPNCNAATVAAGTNCVDAIASTSAWIPPHTKWPYSINWNLGVQHSFGKAFTAEINYVGDRGVHLDVQDRINRQSLVSPSAFLPTYLQAPSQATLDGLANNLASLKAPGNIVPAYRNLPCDDPNFKNSCTFQSSIVGDLPLGSSNYNGLETQLRKRFSGGLAFQAAYTYSRTIDNATADFFSTSLTPRRPQDFGNFAAERSVSPLSRTHRFTIAAVYNLPYFKSGNWLMKNVVGNWGFSPIYTYESPEWADVQSATDANLNGDSAGDRAVFNPSGVSGTGSGITTLFSTNTCSTQAPSAQAGCFASHTVAYLANNPSAQYIKAGAGALATAGRNTLATDPTNDVDLAVYKDLNLTERFKFRLGAQFANILNHPQFIPGGNPGLGLGVNDVTGFNTISGGYLNYLTPGNVNFNNPKSVFPGNARTIGLVAKVTF